MILRNARIQKRLYLTPTCQLVEEKGEDAFTTLFAEEYQKARAQGQSEGEQIGYERALSELTSLIALMRHLCDRLLEQKGQLLEQMKSEVVEFALRVCEKVIRKELSDPQMLMHLIHQLLEQAAHAFQGEEIRIFLAPQDYEMVKKYLHSVRREERGGRLSFHPDALMCRGDCRMEAATGILNADLVHALDDLKMKIVG